MKRSFYTFLFLLAALLLWSESVQAADFSFGFMIRAGLPGAAEWELQIGPSSGSLTTPQSQLFNPAGFGINYFGNNTPHRFEVGYRSVTNQAYVRVHSGSSAASPFLEATYAAPGGTSLTGNATWTIPTNGLYITATGNGAGAAKPTTGVRVENLAWGAGTSGPTLANLSVSQTGSAPAATAGVPLTTFLSGVTGDWVLTGEFRFAGLSAYQTNGAQRSQLQFGFNVSGTDTAVPEPSTWMMIASSLVFLAWRARRQSAAR